MIKDSPEKVRKYSYAVMVVWPGQEGWFEYGRFKNNDAAQKTAKFALFWDGAKEAKVIRIKKGGIIKWMAI